MKPYLLTELPKNIYNAGYKAKNDIRRALSGRVIDLTVGECFRFDKLPAFWRLLRQLRALPKGAELILQCPIYSFFNKKFLPLLCRAIQRRRLRLTLILHDVDSLRYQDTALNQLERQLYGMADRVVVHNEEMKKVLWDTHGIPMEKMTVLGIFDYLLDTPSAGADRTYTKTVLVAGNLAPDKAGYLYQLEVPVNLYGGGFDAAQAGENLHYMGSFSPDELPAHLMGNFGLIWDGDSPHTCMGQTGEYLRINNPHKTSLYLAAGFPVIIWKQAALARFITDNGLGLAVDSLTDLPAALKELTPEAYEEMRQRVEAFGARLRDGAYIRRALTME